MFQNDLEWCYEPLEFFFRIIANRGVSRTCFSELFRGTFTSPRKILIVNLFMSKLAYILIFFASNFFPSFLTSGVQICNGCFSCVSLWTLVESFINHDSLKQKTISSKTIFSKQSKSPFPINGIKNCYSTRKTCQILEFLLIKEVVAGCLDRLPYRETCKHSTHSDQLRDQIKSWRWVITYLTFSYL